jgi:hypothetical protein
MLLQAPLAQTIALTIDQPHHWLAGHAPKESQNNGKTILTGCETHALTQKLLKNTYSSFP